MVQKFKTKDHWIGEGYNHHHDISLLSSSKTFFHQYGVSYKDQFKDVKATFQKYSNKALCAKHVEVKDK